MQSTLTRTRAKQLIDAFHGKTILVLGDMMLDEFVWGKVRRISPEAPVPVVEVSNETYLLGGAGNVVANIHAMEGLPIPLGVIGRDRAADRLLHLLNELGVESTGMLACDRATTVKTRVVAHNQQIVRTDRESRAALTPAETQQLAESFRRWLPSADAIVVSDYDKGAAGRDLLCAVLPEARRAGIPVFLDPKVQNADYYRPITMITPNQREAELLSGIAIDSPALLEEAGRKLLEKFACDYALITRGEEGMSLFDRTSSHHLPTFAREVFDVTGAGDTVIATLALARAGGGTIEEASILANHAAGLVVGKVGTATISCRELLADFDARNLY